MYNNFKVLTLNPHGFFEECVHYTLHKTANCHPLFNEQTSQD